MTKLSTQLSTGPFLLVAAVAIAVPLRKVFDYRVDDPQAAQIRPGVRVRLAFGRREVVGIVVSAPREIAAGEFEYRAIREVLDSEPLIDTALIELCSWVADYYHHPLGEVLAAAVPTHLRKGAATSLPQTLILRLTAAGYAALTQLPARSASMKQLLSAIAERALSAADARALAPTAALRRAMTQGWVDSVTSSNHTAIDSELENGLQAAARSTPEQAAALLELKQRLGSYSTSLLEGVTGSGKTEVYLQLTAEVIAKGQQTLVLTPEIGLTPQLTDRFIQRFGRRVASYHSGLSDAERTRTWLRARAGEIDVLIGTRSAVFAPLPRLGLIIIDEEHDVSYKQQEGLRYSARDVALVRARRRNVPAVLGSATPALETLHNAAIGRYAHLHLRQRVSSAAPPRIEIIDVRTQPLTQGLSTPLLDAVERHLGAGGQVLLFLNRRGYAPALVCHACGWVAPCPHCDARMTLHRGRQRLLCHHCGMISRIPDPCPDCGAAELTPTGQGTERIEDTLRLRFPEKRIERFDSDRLARAGEIERLSRAAHAGEIDILVGTQVLAKGHDFSGLSLAGVVDADQALYGTDFRALERMGQLLTQVAGRVGRAGQPGQVLLQTQHPDHPLLLQLVNEGYPAFCEALLRERRAHGLPPFSHLALLRAQAVDEPAALEFLRHARTALPASAEVEVLGPAPATMRRRGGVHRAQLLLRSASRAALHRVIGGWIAQAEPMNAAHGVRWSVDIDPADLF